MRLNRKKTFPQSMMLARFRLKKLPANGIYLQMEIVSIPYRLTLDTEVPDPFVSRRVI